MKKNKYFQLDLMRNEYYFIIELWRRFFTEYHFGILTAKRKAWSSTYKGTETNFDELCMFCINYGIFGFCVNWRYGLFILKIVHTFCSFMKVTLFYLKS